MLTFWQHIEELRTTLIRVGLTILAATALAFFFHKPLLKFLLLPSEQLSTVETTTIESKRLYAPEKTQITLPQGFIPKHPLEDGVSSAGGGVFQLEAGSHLDVEVERRPYLILSPIEGFLTALKISFWTGLVLSSPLWLYFLLQFILPALEASERKQLIPFLALLYLLLFAGFTLALKGTLPIVGTFFATFNAPLGYNAWGLSHVASFTLSLLLAHGFAFELWGVLLLLTHFGYISTGHLTAARKGVIVAIFFLAALLTPPDVASQLLLALPLVGFYELTILYSRFRSFRAH